MSRETVGAMRENEREEGEGIISQAPRHCVQLSHEVWLFSLPLREKSQTSEIEITLSLTLSSSLFNLSSAPIHFT